MTRRGGGSGWGSFPIAPRVGVASRGVNWVKLPNLIN